MNEQLLVVTVADYEAADQTQLSFSTSEELVVLDRMSDQWWWARNTANQEGYIPVPFVEVLGPATLPSGPQAAHQIVPQDEGVPAQQPQQPQQPQPGQVLSETEIDQILQLDESVDNWLCLWDQRLNRPFYADTFCELFTFLKPDDVLQGTQIDADVDPETLIVTGKEDPNAAGAVQVPEGQPAAPPRRGGAAAGAGKEKRERRGLFGRKKKKKDKKATTQESSSRRLWK